MTLAWTILLTWFALSLPLAVLVGKGIQFGSAEPAMPASGNATRRKREHRTSLVPAR